MPVTYNKDKGKWCVGDNCVYDSEESAQKAYKGYLASEHEKAGKAFRLGIVTKLAEKGIGIDEFHVIGAQVMEKEAWVKEIGTAALLPAALATILLGGAGYIAGLSPIGDVVNAATDFGTDTDRVQHEARIRSKLTKELEQALKMRTREQEGRLSQQIRQRHATI